MLPLRFCSRLVFVVAFASAADASARAQAPAPADFTGSWLLNPKMSDDVKTKIEAATGPANMSGTKGLGLLPWPGEMKEPQRVEFRQFLLDRVGFFERVAIRQTPSQIEIVHGEDDVRIYYFGREHARNDAQGRMLQCRNRWEGAQLVIEEDGQDKSKLIQVLTAVPSRRQLVYNVRLHHAGLKEPVELKLLYDLATPWGLSLRSA